MDCFDDNSLAYVPDDVREQFRKQQDFKARFPARPVTCPFCGTEAVTSAEWEERGFFGWGMSLSQPPGMTVADMEGKIPTAPESGSPEQVSLWYCENGHQWRIHTTIRDDLGRVYDRWDVAAGPISGPRLVLYPIAPLQRVGDVIFTPLRIVFYAAWLRIESGLELRLPSPDIGRSPSCRPRLRDDIGTHYRFSGSLIQSYQDKDFAGIPVGQGVRFANFPRLQGWPQLAGTLADGIYRYRVDANFVPNPPPAATKLSLEITALNLGRWHMNAETQRQEYAAETVLDGPWRFALPVPPADD